MSIKVGLVGLPNVGKSTLFNALTNSQIPAENFPFCTIEPHEALRPLPDARLDKLAEIFGSKKLIPNTVKFVDIAGLVAGASKGEGLGNQFLSNIMECSLIVHVLRCFESDDITHVNNTVDPIEDFKTIQAELLLKDLETLENRSGKVIQQIKKFQNKPKEKQPLELEKSLIEQAQEQLNNGDTSVLNQILEQARNSDAHFVHLLSSKPFLVATNLSEDDFSDGAYKENELYKKVVAEFGQDSVIPVSAQIEAELAGMSDEDAAEMRQDLAFTISGLDGVTFAAYKKLGLISFFTCGPKEAHAWSVKDGATVPEAAGEIHSDLQRGFICSEVYNAKDIIELGSEAALKTSGKLRTEGKEYVVQDGDLLNIRFNV